MGSHTLFLTSQESLFLVSFLWKNLHWSSVLLHCFGVANSRPRHFWPILSHRFQPEIFLSPPRHHHHHHHHHHCACVFAAPCSCMFAGEVGRGAWFISQSLFTALSFTHHVALSFTHYVAVFAGEVGRGAGGQAVAGAALPRRAERRDGGRDRAARAAVRPHDEPRARQEEKPGTFSTNQQYCLMERGLVHTGRRAPGKKANVNKMEPVVIANWNVHTVPKVPKVHTRWDFCFCNTVTKIGLGFALVKDANTWECQ